jgi:hypothetical protein
VGRDIGRLCLGMLIRMGGVMIVRLSEGVFL